MRENRYAKPDVQHFQREIANISYNELFSKTNLPFKLVTSKLSRKQLTTTSLLCVNRTKELRKPFVIVNCVIDLNLSECVELQEVECGLNNKCVVVKHLIMISFYLLCPALFTASKKQSTVSGLVPNFFISCFLDRKSEYVYFLLLCLKSM